MEEVKQMSRRRKRHGDRSLEVVQCKEQVGQGQVRTAEHTGWSRAASWQMGWGGGEEVVVEVRRM